MYVYIYTNTEICAEKYVCEYSIKFVLIQLHTWLYMQYKYTAPTCVTTILQSAPFWLAIMLSRMNCGTCVVFPHPVFPLMMTTWWRWMAVTISAAWFAIGRRRRSSRLCVVYVCVCMCVWVWVWGWGEEMISSDPIDIWGYVWSQGKIPLFHECVCWCVCVWWRHSFDLTIID